MANDESATLLDNPREQSTALRTRRSQVVRVLVGVVAAAVLVVGSVIAVDAIADQRERVANDVDVAMLDETVPSPEDTQLEAQFGWKTITSGWCSLRASTECLFSKDKPKCKEGVYSKCSGTNEASEHEHDGSGSGSGSHRDGPAVGEHHNATHGKHHKKRHHKKHADDAAPEPTKV